MTELGEHREGVAARLAEVTGRPLEEMQGFARHLRADAFQGEGGVLDVAAVDAYAASVLGPPPPPAKDPVLSRLSRQRPAGNSGSGPTLADRRAEAAEQMSPRGRR